MKTKKPSRSAQQKRRVAIEKIKRIKASTVVKPHEITVYCVDGPAKGETFTTGPRDYFYVTLPNNPRYKAAHYKITGNTTHLHEHIAIHIGLMDRVKLNFEKTKQ